MRGLKFNLRTLLSTFVAIALVTGFVVQQVRIQSVQRQLGKSKSRGPLLLFRVPSQPDRIGVCIEGRFVFFNREALIASGNGGVRVCVDGDRLAVELRHRRLTCSTLIIDNESGRTVIDDPHFFERIGVDLDMALK
jgi:hypothetical protein